METGSAFACAAQTNTVMLAAYRCSSRTAYITSSRRGSARVYAKIGLFYSTSTGHTEEIAYQIQSVSQAWAGLSFV